jgi:hypothetical protein
VKKSQKCIDEYKKNVTILNDEFSVVSKKIWINEEKAESNIVAAGTNTHILFELSWKTVFFEYWPPYRRLSAKATDISLSIYQCGLQTVQCLDAIRALKN